MPLTARACSRDRAIDLNAPFFTRQQRIVLANSGRVDPEKLTDYIAAGGYQSLANALTEMTPARGHRRGQEERAARTRRRGLSHRPQVGAGRQADRADQVHRLQRRRGRSRARSWTAACSKAIRTACSKAWRSPATPWARSRATSTCAANTASPSSACRRPSSRPSASTCWAVAILDSGFEFRIDLRIGAGAFVCGEETALIASIEGKRGQPRQRPPYPPESGLWGHPR